MNSWDERYSVQGFFYGQDPNDFLRLCAPHLPKASQVLSLGEGEGRNARHLLSLGHHLVCVDGSQVARDKALKFCKPYQDRLDYRVEDLAFSEWNEGFDAVVSIWCHLPSRLRRQVHGAALRALKPGGLFILEAYRPEQIPLGTGGPKDVDMLMTENSVREELPGLDFIILQDCLRVVREGEGHQGRSATLQLLGRRI